MKKILLSGDSILLAGLAARLQSVAKFEIIQSDLKGFAPADLSGLEDIDAVIIDLATGSPDTPLNWFRAYPSLLLIGLDSATGTLTALSGQACPVSSVEQVVEWLTRKDDHPATHDVTSVAQDNHPPVQDD
jgi:hypothetical protein